MPTESALTGDRLPQTVLQEIAVNLVKETAQFQRASRRLLFDLLEAVPVQTIDERETTTFNLWLLIVVRGRVLVRKEAEHLPPIETTASRAKLLDDSATTEFQPGAYWVPEAPLDGGPVRLSTRQYESAYVLAVRSAVFRKAFFASPALAYSYDGPPVPPAEPGEPQIGGSGPPFDPVAPVTPLSATRATRDPATAPLHARGALDVPSRLTLGTSAAESRARFAASTTAVEAADAAVPLSATVRRRHPGRQRRRHRRRIRLGILRR